MHTIFRSVLGSLFAAALVSSVGATSVAASPRPVKLAKATAEEKKQKKIDKAVAAYEKKLAKLRTKYLEKMKPEQLARKTTKQIEKETKAFVKAAEKITKAGADDAVVGGLEEKRAALFKEVMGAHSAAQIGAKKKAIEKLLEPREIKKALLNPRKPAERFAKELAALQELGVPDADVEDYRKKRAALLGGAEDAANSANVEDKRGRISSPAQSVAVEEGAEKISPMKPTWCEGVLEAQNDRFFESFQPSSPPEFSDFSRDRLKRMALFSCWDPEFPLRQQWTAAMRQQLSNSYHLTAAQNEDIMKLIPTLFHAKASTKKKGRERSRNRDSGRSTDTTADDLCAKLQPLSNGTREVKASRSLERMAVGCGNRLNRENAFNVWDLDIAGGFKSQLARTGFIDSFLPGLRGSYEPENYGDGARSWATKFVLVNAIELDAKAFESELSKMGLSKYGETKARLNFYGTKARMARYTKALRGEAKKTPGLAKMLFDGPAASLKRFEAENAKAKKVLDTVLAIEDRLYQPAAITGCGENLFKQFKPYIKKAMASQKKAAPHEIRFNDMEGFLFVYGMTTCGLKDEVAPVMDYTFGTLYYVMSPMKGPLTAAYRGMVEGYNAAIGNQKTGGFSSERGGGGPTGKLPAPDTNPIKARELPPSTHGYMGWGDLNLLGSAVVKSVKKSGGNVTVKFGTNKWKEPILKCKETNKIDRIGSDGKIHYKFKCKKVGEREVSSTQKPLTVPAWAAAGVKKGALIRFMRYPNGVKQDRAWIIEAFATKKGKKRTSIFGAPL